MHFISHFRTNFSTLATYHCFCPFCITLGCGVYLQAASIFLLRELKSKQGHITFNYQPIFVTPFLFLALPPPPHVGSPSALQGHSGDGVLKMMRNKILSFEIFVQCLSKHWH